MSATAPFDCLEQGEVLPVLVPTGGTATLYAGNLGAIDANGTGVLASNTAGLRVVGRIEEDVVNGDNVEHGGAQTIMSEGVFRYRNSAGHPLTPANVGGPCYVEGSETVSQSSGTNGIKAGVVVQLGGEDAAGNVDPTQPFVFVDTRTARAI